MLNDALKKLAVNLDAARQALDEVLRSNVGSNIDQEQSHIAACRQTAYETAVKRHRERFAKANNFRNAEIFSDPALDILLDLYIHQSRAEPAAARNVIVSSSGSAATALRWLKVLEKEGLIARSEEPIGGSTGLVRLTEDGFDSMTTYLCELSAIATHYR